MYLGGAWRRCGAGEGVVVAVGDVLLLELLAGEGPAAAELRCSRPSRSCVQKNFRDMSGSCAEESRRRWRVGKRPGLLLPPERSEVRRNTAEVSGVVLLQPGGKGWSGVWGNGVGRTRGLKGGGPGFDSSLKLAD